MSDLPPERVTSTFPFNRVGLDFAAPLYVKDEQRPALTAYICLFTCIVTRAVHLEVVFDMTTARIGDVADRVEVQHRLSFLVRWLLGAACQIDEERSEEGLGESITAHIGVAHSAVRRHPARISDPAAADETSVESMAGRVSGDSHLTKEMYENQTAAGKGDIVFLVEESVLRNRWKLGMIIEPLTGSDGVTRTVKVRTARGLLIRLRRSLILLEQASVW
ncbi:hypothetical protein T02_15476 [Trichinella nativa]|uniref:DUF5641 domain-containing protein n=1 Tax=Trichinella nativa TaxID=6335 RepID=A0A0V1L5W3_9BILA|nr:hypothetical protein T02_15476 [Trichinella nativa]